MYSKHTAHISSNGSHLRTARVLVYWTYKVSKFGYGRRKWAASIYSKYTAHIILNGSHFLMIYTTEHIRLVNLGMDGQSEWLLCTLWVRGRALAPRGSSIVSTRLQRRRATPSDSTNAKKKPWNIPNAAQTRHKYQPLHIDFCLSSTAW